MELSDLVKGAALLTTSWVGVSALFGEFFYRTAGENYNNAEPEVKKDIKPPKRKDFYLDFVMKRPLAVLHSVVIRDAWKEYEGAYSKYGKLSK